MWTSIIGGWLRAGKKHSENDCNVGWTHGEFRTSCVCNLFWDDYTILYSIYVVNYIKGLITLSIYVTFCVWESKWPTGYRGNVSNNQGGLCSFSRPPLQKTALNYIEDSFKLEANFPYFSQIYNCGPDIFCILSNRSCLKMLGTVGAACGTTFGIMSTRQRDERFIPEHTQSVRNLSCMKYKYFRNLKASFVGLVTLNRAMFLEGTNEDLTMNTNILRHGHLQIIHHRCLFWVD